MKQYSVTYTIHGDPEMGNVEWEASVTGRPELTVKGPSRDVVCRAIHEVVDEHLTTLDIKTVSEATEYTGYTLEQTCFACPEQYDVYNRDGIQVGYLRLRHGYFRADYPDVGVEVVYETSNVIGDGIFEDEEREIHISKALLCLREREMRR
jgi:hypothetical protein